MNVRVKLFAVAKELAGCDELSVELPDGAAIRDLRSAIVIVAPALARIVPHALWAEGAQYANDATPLNENSEVALIPPVSGG
jgi:molybdopterin converting factor small subunit